MKSNLKVLMAKKDITQEELSSILGLHRTFISKLINGKVKEVRITNLVKLSEFFDNCPIQELMYFVPEEKNV